MRTIREVLNAIVEDADSFGGIARVRGGLIAEAREALTRKTICLQAPAGQQCACCIVASADGQRPAHALTGEKKR